MLIFSSTTDNSDNGMMGLWLMGHANYPYDCLHCSSKVTKIENSLKIGVFVTVRDNYVMKILVLQGNKQAKACA